MAELLHDFISPADELESKGIGDPTNHTLYRPDAFWKVGGRRVCVEVEKKPFLNKLEAKLRKAHGALQEVRRGWEPAKDKIKLWPSPDWHTSEVWRLHEDAGVSSLPQDITRTGHWGFLIPNWDQIKGSFTRHSSSLLWALKWEKTQVLNT